MAEYEAGFKTRCLTGEEARLIWHLLVSLCGADDSGDDRAGFYLHHVTVPPSRFHFDGMGRAWTFLSTDSHWTVLSETPVDTYHDLINLQVVNNALDVLRFRLRQEQNKRSVMVPPEPEPWAKSAREEWVLGVEHSAEVKASIAKMAEHLVTSRIEFLGFCKHGTRLGYPCDWCNCIVGGDGPEELLPGQIWIERGAPHGKVKILAMRGVEDDNPDDQGAVIIEPITAMWGGATSLSDFRENFWYWGTEV